MYNELTLDWRKATVETYISYLKLVVELFEKTGSCYNQNQKSISIAYESINELHKPMSFPMRYLLTSDFVDWKILIGNSSLKKTAHLHSLELILYTFQHSNPSSCPSNDSLWNRCRLKWAPFYCCNFRLKLILEIIWTINRKKSLKINQNGCWNRP